MRLRRACGSGLALALLVVSAEGVAAQAGQAPSASQLMRTALSDGNARGSVHFAESQVTASFKVTLSGDVATGEGRQDITRSGGETAHVLVAGGTAYLSGNQPALIHYFGFPASVAHAIGSNWVSVPPSSSGYTIVAADATLPSAMATLAIPGHVAEIAPTTVDGQSVDGIRGKVPIPGSSGATVTTILYVSRSRTPLPVEAVYSYSKGGSATVTLSRWGERVTVQAPATAIPQSQL